MLPIFVVNLKKDVSKRNSMKSLCKKYGLKPVFFEAIDGREIDGKVIRDSVSRSNTLSPGEMGCALSHKKIYETIIKEGFEWSVILEDDVQFGDAFIEIVEDTEKIPMGCEILLLGHHSCNARDLPTAYSFRCIYPWAGGKVIARPIEDACGTYGYMISLTGAKKLLGEMVIVEKPADHYTGDSGNPSLFIVVPPAVLIDKELDRLSAIEGERRKKEKRKSSWKNRLLERAGVRALYRLRHRIFSWIKGMMGPPCPHEKAVRS